MMMLHLLRLNQRRHLQAIDLMPETGKISFMHYL